MARHFKTTALQGAEAGVVGWEVHFWPSRVASGATSRRHAVGQTGRGIRGEYSFAAHTGCRGACEPLRSSSTSGGIAHAATTATAMSMLQLPAKRFHQDSVAFALVALSEEASFSARTSLRKSPSRSSLRKSPSRSSWASSTALLGA
jgi:hypothetical protein